MIRDDFRERLAIHTIEDGTPETEAVMRAADDVVAMQGHRKLDAEMDQRITAPGTGGTTHVGVSVMAIAAQYNTTAILPGRYKRDGDDRVVMVEPDRPCPELLTAEEAILYLRLDQTGVEDPSRTLRYYREKGMLRATQVGRRVRYRRIELEALLDRLTAANPR